MITQPALTTHRLTTGYGDLKISENLDLTLSPGELVCLLGPNGSGKSTLLRTLTGLQRKLSGEIRFQDVLLERLSPRALARKVSVVLTERIDSGNLTVYSLVGLGRHPYTGWLGTLSVSDHQIIRNALASVGALELAESPVNALSDGQRQKVMIARALAQEPDLLVLDEPTAFLDLPHRVEVMRILHRLAHEENRSVLLSTHDLDLALRNADRFWLMDENGAIHNGGPEDLVLSGAIGEVFRREGVEFDENSGTFVSIQDNRAEVYVVGDGLSLKWTRRALQRAGYQITETSRTGLQVHVIGKNGSSSWHILNESGQATYHSIYDVITYLRTHL